MTTTYADSLSDHITQLEQTISRITAERDALLGIIYEVQEQYLETESINLNLGMKIQAAIAKGRIE